LKTVIIHPKKTGSIERQHPWIFSGAICSSIDGFNDGEIVSVRDVNNKFLAIGHFQNATIAVRILSFREEEIDQNYFNNAIANAVNLRKSLNLFRTDNSICRLIHGEGDGLPGLIVDFYNGVAVIQCHSIGMYLSISMINVALQTVLKNELKAVYSKSSETLPDRLNASNSYLFGSCETPHVAVENGVNYEIDWVNGQKTGFFIDQRENRKLLGNYSIGKKILNTFCYSGGFSLKALINGASCVYSLDSSSKAIELTERNINLNQFSGIHKSIVADAMHYIKDVQEDFDIIILDPPAFAKHRDKKHKAVQGYKRLNAHAMRHIKSGGIIFTFSCSQVIDKTLFTNTIIAAAIESGRKIRILEQLHQPADHPINAFHQEGEYLKGLIIQVD